MQTREDGVKIDQILLSPSKYIASAPGALKNDRTIFPATGGSGSAFTLERGPYLQQVGATAATVLWATRESGTGVVVYTSASGGSGSAAATSRRVAASTSGLPYDYYQYEARLKPLAPGTAQTYDLFVSGEDVHCLARRLSAPRLRPAPGPSRSWRSATAGRDRPRSGRLPI